MESKTDCIHGSIKLVIYLLNNMGKFFESTIEFLIANDSIKMTDIILGTKWLRKHNVSLNLKKDLTLELNLKDNKGNWAIR